MKIKRFPFQMRDIWRIAKGKGIDFDSLPHKPKGFWSRFVDLLLWFFRYDEVQYYYYIMGFEAKSRKQQNDFISQKEYYKLLSKKNSMLVNAGESLNYRILTYDKYVANNYLQSIGVPVVRNEALIINNHVLWTEGGEGRLDSLLSAGFESIYIKPVFGSFGLGVMRLEIMEQAFFYKGEPLRLEDLDKKLAGDMWVVQKMVKQHSKLDKFNSSAANTLRVTTMLNQGEPEFVTSFMRISTGQSHVDNWDSGSLLLGVHHPEGVLWEKGFYKPKKYIMETCAEHPNSKISFKDYAIPFYSDAVEIALRVHKFYYGRFMLALDIAITEQGPVIIEVNCVPSYVAIQMLSGGLKKRMTIKQSQNIL